MAFTLPDFNLALQVWVPPNAPNLGGPDLTGMSCQLYIHNRHNQDITPTDRDFWVPPIILRIPVGWQPEVGEIYGVDGNTNTYYKHRFGHRIHQGFPNEYWMIVVEMCTPTGATPVFQQEL